MSWLRLKLIKNIVQEMRIKQKRKEAEDEYYRQLEQEGREYNQWKIDNAMNEIEGDSTE